MTIKFYGLNRDADQSPDEINVGTSTALADATTADTDATTADTDAETAVTDLATALGDLDAIATDGTDGIIALLGSGTGGTYAYASHQITGTADTTPAITQAQANALVALFNTAMTAVLAAQTALNTAKTATATTKTATAAAKVSAALPNDVVLSMDLSKAPTCEDVRLIMDAFERRLVYAGPSDIGNI